MDISTTSTATPSISALLLRLLTARRPHPRRAPRPVLAQPQRIGDGYRWPDGSWTHCG